MDGISASQRQTAKAVLLVMRRNITEKLDELKNDERRLRQMIEVQNRGRETKAGSSTSVDLTSGMGDLQDDDEFLTALLEFDE